MEDDKLMLEFYANQQQDTEVALVRDAALHDCPIVLVVVAGPDGIVASGHALVEQDVVDAGWDKVFAPLVLGVLTQFKVARQREQAKVDGQ